MANFLNELLKPIRLDVDPSSQNAPKQFKHWLKVFSDFVAGCVRQAAGQDGQPQVDRLRILFAYVSADVYEFVEGCETYEGAIDKLKSVYIKTPNVIFARHVLATRKQKQGEKLRDFFQQLHVLSKDCNIQVVTAEEYRKELVCDAFINGISSHVIRQRLLENSELTVERAFQIACSLETAQQHSEAYLQHPDVTAAVNVEDTDHDNQISAVAKMTSSNKLCYFCGKPYHDRSKCPAKNLFCFTCGKLGHFSSVCRSRTTQRRNKCKVLHNTASTATSNPNLCSLSAAYPGSLLPASLPISVNGTRLTALVDSGSSESYMNSFICIKLNLDVYPTSHQVQMASTSMKTKSTGFCLVDIHIHKSKYDAIRLNLFDDLCSDVILGLDFQRQHQRLIFQFDGERPDLIVSNDKICSVAAATTEKVSLFSNLSRGYRPIATKSRRYNLEDRKFIQNQVDQLLKEGIIQPSSSPWRAQVVIATDECNRHKKRMCEDYSQTINIYTELDAYPLPRIDDMVNELAQYKIFSTFDLSSAYHQIKIIDSEQKFTAFEANGKLYEFTRIPFGVKNGVAAFQRKITQFIEEERLRNTYPYLDYQRGTRQKCKSISRRNKAP